LGLLAWDKGEYEQASTLYSEALIHVQESGNKLVEGFSIFQLGKVSFARGETTQALTNFKQALETPLMWLGNPLLFRNVDLTMLSMEGIAALASKQAQVAAAARLLGATETWHKRFLYNRMPRERQEREAFIAALRDSMGASAWTTAFAEGQALPLEQAVTEALSFAAQENS
jgi:tetratricopeptide (TPR) repeat protein